jgi:hypothetical protein
MFFNPKLEKVKSELYRDVAKLASKMPLEANAITRDGPDPQAHCCTKFGLWMQTICSPQNVKEILGQFYGLIGKVITQGKDPGAYLLELIADKSNAQVKPYLEQLKLIYDMGGKDVLKTVIDSLINLIPDPAKTQPATVAPVSLRA